MTVRLPYQGRFVLSAAIMRIPNVILEECHTRAQQTGYFHILQKVAVAFEDTKRFLKGREMLWLLFFIPDLRTVRAMSLPPISARLPIPQRSCLSRRRTPESHRLGADTGAARSPRKRLIRLLLTFVGSAREATYPAPREQWIEDSPLRRENPQRPLEPGQWHNAFWLYYSQN